MIPHADTNLQIQEFCLLSCLSCLPSCSPLSFQKLFLYVAVFPLICFKTLKRKRTKRIIRNKYKVVPSSCHALTQAIESSFGFVWLIGRFTKEASRKLPETVKKTSKFNQKLSQVTTVRVWGVGAYHLKFKFHINFSGKINDNRKNYASPCFASKNVFCRLKSSISNWITGKWNLESFWANLTE